jgi:hypothetical protein
MILLDRIKGLIKRGAISEATVWEAFTTAGLVVSVHGVEIRVAGNAVGYPAIPCMNQGIIDINQGGIDGVRFEPPIPEPVEVSEAEASLREALEARTEERDALVGKNAELLAQIEAGDGVTFDAAPELEADLDESPDGAPNDDVAGMGDSAEAEVT